MLKKIFTFICFCLVVNAAQAQSYRVYGKITSEEDNENLPGAVVFIQSQNIQAQANANGEYEMNLPQGTYTIECYAFERKRLKQKITVKNQDIKLDFSLPTLTETLKEIKVNAQRNTYAGMGRLRSVDGFGIY
ncbi:MAG TPA: hypothetical protein DCS93_03700, partial [Microscillaceae bacterium]|nr:hypothetical protein [Microscillaceae bacterium]